LNDGWANKSFGQSCSGANINLDVRYWHKADMLSFRIVSFRLRKSRSFRREQDADKAAELSQKINGLQKKLGPEFVALADDLKSVDPNSKDGQEIGSILERLDDLCDD
jgi:hypothetical protein